MLCWTLWVVQACAQPAQDVWYRYPRQAVQAEVITLDTSVDRTHLLVRFPSLVRTPDYPQNQTVYAEVFMPHHNQKMPAVVLLH